MKENWEIKKLGEVCEIVSGSTPKTNIPEYWVNGHLKWVTPAEISNDTKYIYNTERCITQKAVEETGLKPFPKDTVLLSSRAPIGKVAIAGNEMYCNQGFKNFICNKSLIFPTFLFYFLKAKNEYLNSLGRGATFKEISKKIVQNVEIPIPPLPVQESIVKELDLLHHLKELQKQQLAEYDNLAQSTFYSLFGDPIENEKGWEIRKLGDVAPVKSFKGNVKTVDNKFWLLNLDVVEQQSGEILSINLVEESEINQSTVTFNEDNVLYSKLRPYLNKVVIPHMSGYCTSELLPLLPQKDLLNRQFLTMLLRSKSFVHYIQEKTNGAKMPRVNMDEFRNFMLIIPPLSLQNAFAKRIEKIEAQKDLVKQGIAETQLLIDYTMDKYFG